jgi:hypothetical protein
MLIVDNPFSKTFKSLYRNLESIVVIHAIESRGLACLSIKSHVSSEIHDLSLCLHKFGISFLNSFKCCNRISFSDTKDIEKGNWEVVISVDVNKNGLSSFLQ